MWSLIYLFLLPVPLLGASLNARDLSFTIPVISLDPADLTPQILLNDIVNYFELNLDIALAFPGLATTLASYRDGNISTDEYFRGLLKSIQYHSTFSDAFSQLDTDLQTKLTQYMNGSNPEAITKRGFATPLSPGAKHHFKRMEEAGRTPASMRWLNSKRQTSPAIYADTSNQTVVTVYTSAEFENWGLTISNTPSYTFVPTTIVGLSNVVKFAIASGKRVRAAGYRHTWSDIYSEDDQIFVSMLDIKTATAVPDPSSLEVDTSVNGPNEFKSLELDSQDVEGSGGTKRLARIGAAITNEEFRRWSIANGWALPLNTILVEVTMGGSNAPMCHGAGIERQTLSDLVRAIEYVDANGMHQKITNSTQLKAAAGSLGLLGVITHITLELDMMTYADMKPLKQDINLVIPPPNGYTVPVALQKDHTQEELEQALESFIAGAEGSYYAEYFWFPYQPQGFINVWNNTDDSTGLQDYPNPADVFSQWVQGWVGGVINDDPLFRLLPGAWQAIILSSSAMLALPPQLDIVNTEIKTYITDALHFRRGVQNMRVRDMELHIPIPPREDNPTQRNWTVIQQAWWDAIDLVYQDVAAPMRIAVEMRIMGDSEMIMAPQTNNTLGTASIEVLTTMPAVAEGIWTPFAQAVGEKWTSYEANGQRLNVRPHWAKEWEYLTVDGIAMKQHLKDNSFKDQIPVFTGLLADIGAIQGWTLKDLQDRFSCPLLDDVIF